MIANETPTVIFISQIQVLVVLGNTLLMHHNIFCEKALILE
jgi:hypothetical protein